ncbi:MAG: hypothetical protein HY303_15005 [Candidatus Wallbacteria bacterium]|nr:hypothetical protein [Candidatus Wallbacteria bacterium]
MAGAAALKPQDFRTVLARRETVPPAVVLLAGPEPYFKEEALAQLALALEKRAGAALNRVTLDAASTELEGVFATHLSPSLFGGEKLVVLRNFDKARAPERKSFLKSLGQCQFPAGIHLAILSEDMKSAPPELKGPQVMAVAFYVPWKSELLPWIQERLRKAGVQPAPRVPEMLYRMHGKAVPWKSDLEVDIYRLSMSIERLGRHVSGRTGVVVDEAAVTAVLGRGEPPDVFRLVELVGRRDRATAMRELRAFLEEAGESPIGLVALLLDRFDKLIRINAASRSVPPAAWQDVVRRAKAFESATRGDTKKTALAALGACLAGLGERFTSSLGEAKDYQKSALVLQADRYKPSELADRFGALVELDRKLKSGGGDERAEIELFVAGL